MFLVFQLNLEFIFLPKYRLNLSNCIEITTKTAIFESYPSIFHSFAYPYLEAPYLEDYGH